MKSIENAMDDEDWEVASNRLDSLVQANPEHPKISLIREQLAVAQEAMEERKGEADKLIAQARELDKGTYSVEALKLVEEAMRLFPSKENRELYQRMSSYGKVIKVPGDYETISEALKKAEKNDRVFVTKGTYQESLIIPNGVELVGESRSDTIIECSASVGAVISILSGAEQIRVSSLTLRHSGLVNDDERYPVLTVDGGSLEADDLLVARASGHGIAVINGGRARVNMSKFTDSGWDGISVAGRDSRAELTNVTSEKNLHHGADFWQGASGRIQDCTFAKNGRSGLLAIASEDVITVEKSRSEGNREVGFFFSEMSGVVLSDCDAHENLLGGMFFERKTQGVQLLKNRVSKNGEAGIVIEKGVEILSESGNTVDANKGKQIWKDAVFPVRALEETVSPPPPVPPLESPGEEKPS